MRFTGPVEGPGEAGGGGRKGGRGARVLAQQSQCGAELTLGVAERLEVCVAFAAPDPPPVVLRYGFA